MRSLKHCQTQTRILSSVYEQIFLPPIPYFLSIAIDHMRSTRANVIQHGFVSGIDTRLSNAVYRKGQNIPRFIYKILEFFGDGIFWLTVAISALVTPVVFSTRHAWAVLLAALLLDLILVGLLKILVRRNRPVYNTKHKDMVVVIAVDQYSFPSGHSSRAAMLATLFLSAFWSNGNHTLLCLAAVVWALVTASSRAMMGRHYVGDVLAGALLGVMTTAVITQVGLVGNI